MFKEIRLLVIFGSIEGGKEVIDALGHGGDLAPVGLSITVLVGAGHLGGSEVVLNSVLLGIGGDQFLASFVVDTVGNLADCLFKPVFGFHCC